jgi:hypothetical protein
VAQTTLSAVIPPPPASASSILPFFFASPSTRVEVSTLTPLASHQRLIMSPPVPSIMRGTMRSSISMMVSSTSRATRASSTMQPMKPAPISTTDEPGRAAAPMRRASASVQQFSTPSMSMPGIGGRVACDPVAMSSRSKLMSLPSSRKRRRWPGSSFTTRPPEFDAPACPVILAVAQMGAGFVDVAGQQIGQRHARVRRFGSSPMRRTRAPGSVRFSVSAAMTPAGPLPMIT